MRRVGKGFYGVETPLFEGILVEQEIAEEGDTDEHVEEVNTGDAAEGDDSAAHREVPTVAEEQPIPSPTPPTPPPQDIPSTSHLKRRVKKLEKRNKVLVLKLRRLQRVGTSQSVDKFDDTVMDDEYNQGRMIAEMDKDDVVILKDDKEEDKEVANKDVEEAKVDETAQVQGRQAESQAKIYKIDMDHANKVLSMQEDETEPAEVQEVVDVVTTAKLITEEPKPLKKKQQIEQDEQYARELHAELNKDIDWDEAIDHVELKAKEDPALDYFKGMSYNDIHPIFEAKFNSNVDFLLKTKEQIEEDENIALQMINKTPAEKAAKRRNLNDEVEDLKRHLHIVSNKDDDVYTEATPLSRKVPVVDYEIIEMNNKPYYKIIRADDLEVIGIMWCAYHNLYNHTTDFVSGKKIEEDENIALQMINKTPAEKAAKRRKLNDEVEDLKRHLHIVPNKDDDVYTEATPLARKCCQAKLMLLLVNVAKAKLMLLRQINAAKDKLMLSRQS
nr:hypothetical protein [Tanacetum cinerariifolium]